MKKAGRSTFGLASGEPPRSFHSLGGRFRRQHYTATLQHRHRDSTALLPPRSPGLAEESAENEPGDGDDGDSSQDGLVSGRIRAE